ncbi:pyridoxamine 5'-phosphate oxidase family protein [Rhizobium sp. BR 362]|uniref:pyridoxamine 5'-phosphate oxidase family protein n=1 Tax=Rhizobium sp. BR 362 TaxID=3040670 RepID=UPI002F421F84
MNLSEIDASAWAELEVAAAAPQSGFRYVNLCSADASGRPQARMVVLRRADRARRLVEIHTHTRSSKWQEISARPAVTILGFNEQSRLQLRFQGSAELHGPGSELANEAWDRLSPWTRSTYSGGPPGDNLGEMPATGKANGDAEGRNFFGVLIFRAETMDWLQLRQAENRRAIFSYDHRGVLVDARWINP